MTTETTNLTTEQRHARIILARLASRGPSTPSDIAGDGVPRVETEAFASAFALLTRGRLVRCLGSRPGARGNTSPVFEVTGDGRQLVMTFPPA